MSYTDIEEAAASEYGVPQTLALDLFGAESSNNPYAINSSSGAMGLGQILPSTAANPGYGISPLSNPFDPTSNADFSMQYLAALFQQFGSWVAALLHYYPNAATDPNYASTYAAAQAADAAQGGSGVSQQPLIFSGVDPSIGTGYIVNPLGAGATSQPGVATAQAAGTAVGNFLNNPFGLLARGGLIVLGIGLILVSIMALTRRSDIATEASRLANVAR